MLRKDDLRGVAARRSQRTVGAESGGLHGTVDGPLPTEQASCGLVSARPAEVPLLSGADGQNAKPSGRRVEATKFYPDWKEILIDEKERRNDLEPVEMVKVTVCPANADSDMVRVHHG